jgi:hypothetical protein
LFVDQPVGTGLSYADTSSGRKPFVKSMDGNCIVIKMLHKISIKHYISFTVIKGVLVMLILEFPLQIL